MQATATVDVDEEEVHIDSSDEEVSGDEDSPEEKSISIEMVSIGNTEDRSKVAHRMPTHVKHRIAQHGDELSMIGGNTSKDVLKHKAGGSRRGGSARPGRLGADSPFKARKFWRMYGFMLLEVLWAVGCLMLCSIFRAPVTYPRCWNFSVNGVGFARDKDNTCSDIRVNMSYAERTLLVMVWQLCVYESCHRV